MKLPQLKVNGGQIVLADTNEHKLLRGLNRSGLEYAEPGDIGFLASAGITETEIGEIVNAWGANIIRLPLNQDWALNGRGSHSAEDYLGAIDQVIAWAAARGAYTLLDLQWISMEKVWGVLSDGSPNRIAPLPDENSTRFWRKLAQRYRDEPAALFDLYNEPHDVPADDWVYWAKLLLSTIREARPDALCFISGIDWGYDLTGVPFDAENVVYSTHVYPNKPVLWPQAFGWLTGETAVFAGEWGGTADDLDWGHHLAAYMRELNMGWTAWSWCDYPHLRQDGSPTPFGKLVMNELNPLSETSRNVDTATASQTD